MFKALHSFKYLHHHKYCPVAVSQTTGILDSNVVFKVYRERQIIDVKTAVVKNKVKYVSRDCRQIVSYG